MSWKNDRPTCRQLKLIKDIEAEFGEQFTGTTKGEAADYMRQCDDTNLAWEIWQLVKDGNTDSLYSIEEWLQEDYQEENNDLFNVTDMC